MTNPTILFTGATGFIGGATLAQLLQSACRVLLLVRGETASAAAARIRQSVGRFLDPAGLEGALASCQVICGDLTDARTLDDAVNFVCRP